MTERRQGGFGARFCACLVLEAVAVGLVVVAATTPVHDMRLLVALAEVGLLHLYVVMGWAVDWLAGFPRRRRRRRAGVVVETSDDRSDDPVAGTVESITPAVIEFSNR